MSNFNAAGGSQSNKFSIFIFSTKVYFTFIQSCLRVIRIAPPGLDYFNGNVILNAKRAISDLSKSTTWGHIEKQQNLQRRVVRLLFLLDCFKGMYIPPNDKM